MSQNEPSKTKKINLLMDFKKQKYPNDHIGSVSIYGGKLVK